MVNHESSGQTGPCSLPLHAESPPADSRERARTLLMGLQDSICAGLESLDGEGRFQEESWVRQEGGGGRSRVIKAGRVFEQGGVNFSEVEGDRLPPSILSQRPEAEGHRWFAIGTSMVLHPRNPYIPTVHLNYRYFQAGPVWWFGGGADLTPYYPYLDDARHFHRTLQGACGAVDPAYYPVFKLWCDEYFFLKHRGETRGVGGIFFDYQDGSGALYKGPGCHGARCGRRGGDRAGDPRLGEAVPPGVLLRQRLSAQLCADRREAPAHRLRRAGAAVPALPPGPVRGIQSGLRPGHDLRPADQWPHRIHPDVVATAGALGIRLRTGAGSRETLLTEVFTRPQNWLEDSELEDRCQLHQAVT
jgi:coproporphyrinogen III oxidase